MFRELLSSPSIQGNMQIYSPLSSSSAVACKAINTVFAFFQNTPLHHYRFKNGIADSCARPTSAPKPDVLFLSRNFLGERFASCGTSFNFLNDNRLTGYRLTFLGESFNWISFNSLGDNRITYCFLSNRGTRESRNSLQAQWEQGEQRGPHRRAGRPRTALKHAVGFRQHPLSLGDGVRPVLPREAQSVDNESRNLKLCK